MWLLVVSTEGTPDFWSFQDWEIEELNTARNNHINSGENPLTIHVPSTPSAEARTWDVKE